MNEDNYKKDYEGFEEEEVDLESVKFWEEKQRELVTNVVDYNLATLVDLIKTRGIGLSPKYQRRSRWDEKRQSKLIESFLMNVPVPPIFLNEDTYGQYSVIDGKQRLSAIFNFFQGNLQLKGLRIFNEINGKTFNTLPIRLQTVLRTRVTLRAVIILRQSNSKIKNEVFERLNSGGVTLNAQEVRNSVYPGPFNDLILELSENQKFHKCLGIKVKEKSALFKEMRDVELVLRYFTFRDNWESFTSKMRDTMDSFMEENEKISKSSVEEMRRDFLHTLDAVEACFGEYTFRRWDPKANQWRKPVLASLFDAQMFSCRGLSDDSILPYQNTIIESGKALFSDANFRQSIDSATNTPSFFKNRITITRSMIDKAMAD